jgi:hypothetical protein
MKKRFQLSATNNRIVVIAPYKKRYHCAKRRQAQLTKHGVRVLIRFAVDQNKQGAYC